MGWLIYYRVSIRFRGYLGCSILAPIHPFVLSCSKKNHEIPLIFVNIDDTEELNKIQLLCISSRIALLTIRYSV
jgi:hypothetical protein